MRYYICAIGVILIVACYLELLLSIHNTGKGKKIWSGLMILLGIATVVAMIVSG